MLLLDEPTNHIDLDGLDMIDAIMGSFQGTGEKLIPRAATAYTLQTIREQFEDSLESLRRCSTPAALFRALGNKRHKPLRLILGLPLRFRLPMSRGIRDKALLLVTHKLNLVPLLMDQIVLLDQGGIAAQGSHAQRRQSSAFYAAPWNGNAFSRSEYSGEHSSEHNSDGLTLWCLGPSR